MLLRSELLALRLQVYQKGKFANEYFNRDGELRNIRKLRFWSIDEVLMDKYGFSRREVGMEQVVSAAIHEDCGCVVGQITSD